MEKFSDDLGKKYEDGPKKEKVILCTQKEEVLPMALV